MNCFNGYVYIFYCDDYHSAYESFPFHFDVRKVKIYQLRDSNCKVHLTVAEEPEENGGAIYTELTNVEWSVRETEEMNYYILWSKQEYKEKAYFTLAQYLQWQKRDLNIETERIDKRIEDLKKLLQYVNAGIEYLRGTTNERKH